MSRLPNGYIELEYIESTGGQYIDTGFTWETSTKIDFTIERLGDNAGQTTGTSRANVWFGANGNTGTENMLGWGASGNSNYFRGGTGGSYYVLPLNTKTNITFDYTKGAMKLFVNGVQDGGGSTRDTVTTSKILLGGVVDITTGAPILFCLERFYENVKLWNGETLVADFIPAKRISDSAIGMYDTVSQSFFTNAGTGNFIAGPIAMKIEKFDSVIAIDKARLPEQYQELEYIESSGTQYIDTGYTWTSDKASVETKIYRTEDVTSGHGIYGNQKGTQHGLTLYKFGSSSTSNYGAQFGENGTTISTNLSLQTWYTLAQITDGNIIRFSVNQVEQSQSIKKTLDKTNSVYLFTSHYNAGTDGYAKIRCKYFKLIDNSTLVRNLIPAKRISDNVVGMYDITNSGKNLFDGVMEDGNIGNDGQDADTTNTYYRSKNYTEVKPFTTYQFSFNTSIVNGQFYIISYDEDKNFISRTPYNDFVREGGRIGGYTASANTKFIRFFVYSNSPLPHDVITWIQMEEGSTVTSYEPYPFYTNAGTGSFTAGSVVNPKELVRFNSVIAVQSKNLLDTSNSNLSCWGANSGRLSYYSDGSRHSYIIDIEKAGLRSGDTITASCETRGTVSYWSIGAYEKIAQDEIQLYYVNVAAPDKTATFTIPDNAKYIVVFNGTGFATNQQVEKNSTATPYEPYGNKLVRFNDIIVK